MVLVTSAIIAILQVIPGADRLISALEDADVFRITAANLVEAGIVMQARNGDHGELELDPFVQRLGIAIVPVSADHTELARSLPKIWNRKTRCWFELRGLLFLCISHFTK